MREHKFRFVDKHIDTGSLVIQFTTLDEIEQGDSWQGSTPWRRIAEDAFTGLKDKNGTEIYEGDVIAANSRFRYEVIWDNNRSRFIMRSIFHVKGNRTAFQALPNHSEKVVLGNIYENSDLLDQGVE